MKQLKLEEVVHWRQMTESDSLRGVDLGGKDWTLTIKAVLTGAEFTGGDGKKKILPALEFAETPKKLGMCSANCLSIAAMYGPKPMGWVGKRITVYGKDGVWFGERKPAVRIRDVKPSDSTKAGEA
jgi:hypothetical protein